MISLKQHRDVFFSFFVLFFYVFLSLFVSCIVSNRLVVMSVVDIIMIIICFYYYQRFYRCENKIIGNSTRAIVLSKLDTVPSCFVTPRSEVIALYGLVFVFWAVIQVSASVFYNLYGDASFDAYSDVVQTSLFFRVVLSVLIAPIMEELLFRGIFFNTIKPYSRLLAYLLSSFMFAVFHGTLLHLYAGFSFGLIFVLIYQHTGRLRFAVFAHMFSNFLTLFCTNYLAPFTTLSITAIISVNLMLLVVLMFWYIYVGKMSQKRNIEQTKVVSD